MIEVVARRRGAIRLQLVRPVRQAIPNMAHGVRRAVIERQDESVGTGEHDSTAEDLVGELAITFGSVRRGAKVTLNRDRSASLQAECSTTTCRNEHRQTSPKATQHDPSRSCVRHHVSSITKLYAKHWRSPFRYCAGSTVPLCIVAAETSLVYAKAMMRGRSGAGRTLNSRCSRWRLRYHHRPSLCYFSPAESLIPPRWTSRTRPIPRWS